MCRCCQSLLESCSWHCYEKWKFDENIALYKDETTEKKDSRIVNNQAFWDSVAVIENRAVVTIQPLSTKPCLINQPTTPICPIKINIESPVLLRNKSTEPDVPDFNLTDEEKFIKICPPNGENERKVKFRKKSAMEEKIEKRSTTPNPERLRKKSLKERRNSTANLTLKLDTDFHEIPVIRVNSMPKFYLDYTPEYNPFSETSHVLSSPILPNTPNNGFDLKSVVQIENEIEQEHANQGKKYSSRMVNIRRKMKPILIKKQSSKSLPDTINHI